MEAIAQQPADEAAASDLPFASVYAQSQRNGTPPAARTRLSPDAAVCIDLIITSPNLPAPLAVMLAPSPDPAESLQDPDFLDRKASL
eukprot:gene6351-6584_t